MTRTRSSGPKAPLGQNFLIDRKIQERILIAVHPTPESVVLEIGGGPGNMTELLAQTGARVISVELDDRLAEKLEAKFAGRENVEIIRGDIMKLSISELAARCGVPRLLVFGNLPYYITSPILMKLFANHRYIERIAVMMQSEVALRLIAKPDSADYGLLSLTCRYYAEPRIEFSIPPRAFDPPPKVVSALVSLKIAPLRETLQIRDEAEFWSWMRAAFASRRKTLLNNWKGLAPATLILGHMEQMGIDANTRAEALTLGDLARLYRAVSASVRAAN